MKDDARLGLFTKPNAHGSFGAPTVREGFLNGTITSRHSLTRNAELGDGAKSSISLEPRREKNKSGKEAKSSGEPERRVVFPELCPNRAGAEGGK